MLSDFFSPLYNRRYGENVTSPEFLAKAEKNNHPNLEVFKTLERREAQSRVQEALGAGNDPAIMGETYMQNYAKDSEMHHMIDRAYEIQKEIYENDEFISREFEYQTTLEVAQESIQSAYNDLSQHYNRDDITAEEMPSLMRKMHEENGLLNDDEVLSNIQQLQKSIDDFTSSQEVLQQIDQRKVEVAEEIERHVSHVNKHRVNAGMEEYRPKQPEVRKLRKIEDFRRGKK